MPAQSTTLQRYFTGLAENVFESQLGVADVPLIDYISGLLLRFTRLENLHRVRNLSGRPMTDVVGMLEEARVRVGPARREVHRHIGDFTLFWAGVYPEALRELRSPSKKDHFMDYCAQGKRAYFIASTIDSWDELDDVPSSTLEQLSSHFEMCAYGLREVRREWERRDEDEPPRPIFLD